MGFSTIKVVPYTRRLSLTHIHIPLYYDYILPNTSRRRDGESNTFAAAMTMGMPLTLGLG